jgi:hypothetical protein
MTTLFADSRESIRGIAAAIGLALAAAALGTTHNPNRRRDP